MGRKVGGFTILEMIIVVAIIGILATIAIPKFATAMIKARGGSVKGSLGSLRSALGIYYADTEARFPTDLTALVLNGKYLNRIPMAKGLSEHPASDSVALQIGNDDSGGWSYNNVASNQFYGVITINCTHTDLKGTVWSTY